MNRRRHAILVFFYGLACLFGGVVLGAEEEEGALQSTHFTLTDHLIFSNAQAPGRTTGPYANLFMHEDKPRLEYDNYAIGIHFTNQFTTNGNKDLNAPFQFEKAYGTADWKSWNLRLGDSYQMLGRGIALALYQDAPFGLDNTLQGASVRYHPGPVDVTLLGGRVNPIHNPVAINPFDYPLKDHNFWVAGGSFQGNVTKETHLGAQYVHSVSQPTLVGTPDFDQTWDTIGVTAGRENLVDGLDLYAESNVLYSQQQPLVGQYVNLPRGRGSYASVSYAPGPWQIRLEGIDYDNYFYPFQKPPTLEDQLVAFLNTEQESAARLYGEYRTEGGTTFYSSLLGGWDHLDASNAFPIYHPVVGTKFHGPLRTEYELKAGYREMAYFGRMWHAGLKWKIPTFKSQSVELNATSINWRRAQNTPYGVVDYRNLFNLTYTFSERINAGLGYEWVPQSTLSVGHHFFSLGGMFKAGGLTTKAFLGQTSGGMQCSGGICRQVPSYSGAMVESNYVF